MAARQIATAVMLIAALSGSVQIPATAQQPYVLGPEDVIEVVVFGNPDVSRVVTIRPDGAISLPLVGEVQAAGLTPGQLGVRLTDLFATYVRQPRVSVIVREFHRIRVAVLGQVTKPGVVDLAQGATVLDALAAAGGLAPDAGLGDARLLRAQEPAVVIDLERLLLQGDLSLNQPLMPGDSVIVPDDATARIYVLGEVVHPGILPLRGSLTALQALTLVGGPTRRALLNRAHVIRRAAQPAASETITLNSVVVARQSTVGLRVIPVDLLKVIREGDIARDLPLQRGDVLYIPDNPIALENIALLLGVVADAAVVLR